MDILANAADKVKYGTIGWEILSSVATYIVFGERRYKTFGYTQLYFEGKRIKTRKRFTQFVPAREIDRSKSNLAKKHKSKELA